MSAPQPPPDATGAVPPRYDLFKAFGMQRPATTTPRAFSTAINSRLSKPIDVAAGESIFDPQVVSRYFDDPDVPDRDKQAIVNNFQPSTMSSAFDDAVRQSVGEPIRSRGILSRAISSTIDIAGKPIGKVFDALQWPSDRTEQLFGLVLSYGYDSDLSLSERWRMGRLTYEAYGQTGWWKFQGDDKLNEWSQEVSSGQKTIDEQIAEHEHGVPDLVGKMILDPLWLLGGFPAVPGKLFKTGEKGAEVYKTGLVASWFRGLGEGIRLEQFGSAGIDVASKLAKIPVVGKPLYKASELLFGGFLPTQDRVFEEAIARWRSSVMPGDFESTLRSWRDAKGLFNMTPQSKADHVFNALTTNISLAKASPDDIVQLARAVETGDLRAVPKVFGAGFETKEGRIVFQALKDMGVELRRFPSMQRGISPTEALWDAAEPGAQKTLHRNAGAFTAALHQDLFNIAYPAVQRWHGVEGVFKQTTLKSGEVFQKFYPQHSLVQKFTNGMKFALATTLLNRPGFVALNYLNNGMTLAFDWGLSRGVKYWLDPLGKRGILERDLAPILKEDGLTLDVIKANVGDRSTARELLFGGELGGQTADKLLGIDKTWIAPMVAVTSTFDMGARLHAFYEMYGRARNATWKFEGVARGTLPDIPDELATRLGPQLTGRLRGAIMAAGPNAEKLRAIADDILQRGRPPLTAEHFLEKMADELRLEGDARQAFNDMFDLAFKERVTAILADAGNDTGRLTSRLDRLRGAFRQQEHQARALDNLMPRPRDYRNLPTGVADHEALMAERDKTQLIQLRRFLVATNDPRTDEILRSFAEWQDTARKQRYVLEYTSQLLDIAPGRLAGDTMFQLVPEDLRPAVREAHSDLLSGFDELDPQRTPGEFFEVLGDLSGRWENYASAHMQGLIDTLGKIEDPSQPVMDFFNSIGDAEGRVAQSRDSLFADLITNHPGADASQNAAEWVSSRWTDHYRSLDNLYNDALGREAGIFGFEHRMPPRAQGGEYPTVGEMLGVRNSNWDQYLDYVARGHLLEKDAQPFVDDLPELGKYLNGLASRTPDIRRLQIGIARGAADFTMLNYDNRYGIDHWASVVYPYAFWPTRSMWHWAQRGLSRPGAVAATAKLYNLIQDVNDDAGISQRFKQSIRIPVPFLDKSLQGGPMYFDPIKVLFPTADWSSDNNFDQTDGSPGKFFGIPRNSIAAVNQWAKVVGPGLNPFIDTALQYAGGNERALYLKYRFSAMPFMIPGPRQLQALWSFTQAGEDPDNLLDDSTKEALATGQHLPEDKLKQVLSLSDDEFDLYRTQRVLANQVGDYMLQGRSLDERKAFVRAALDAMFTQKGPLWNNARKIGKQENGLAVVTGWLFGTPVRQYPNGEATSRGVQALYVQVQQDSRASGGGDMTAAFTNMFPEIEVRNAAVSIFNGTDKQDSEIAGSLFAQDLAAVNQKYGQRISNLAGTVDRMYKQGLARTEEGRRQIDVAEAQQGALTQQRSLEVDDLDKRYNARNQEPSLSRTPRTRALQTLEQQYYSIEVPANATSIDFQKQKAQQQAFIDALPAGSEYSPFGAAVSHYVKMKQFDRQITAAYDAGNRDAATRLVEERQQFVRDETAAVQQQITQKDFRNYLDRNKRPPTRQELESNRARDLMSEYFAIKDRGAELGYTTKETAALAGAFWDANPLLKKYYGNGPSVDVRSYEDIQRYDRMETIWENFYALQGGSQARIDYLAMTLDELNGLRKYFGLSPVKLTDPYWNQNAPPPRYEGSLPQGY